MKQLSKFFPNRAFLFITSIGAGLLLAACSGSAGPATSETAVPQPTSAEHSEQVVANPDPTADPSPKPTAETAHSQEASGDTETDSTTSPTAAAAAHPTRKPASAYADLEIVTLLPPDAIPAINNPEFLSAEEADQFYDPEELVMGVSFNGDSRAYSAPFLSNHEIVNDTVGGVKIAVTW